MRLASILVVAAVATAQNTCNNVGVTNPCRWNTPRVTIPSNGGSVPNGYRSGKATLKDNEWAVFNLDFTAEYKNQMVSPVLGWTQYFGVKVEKSASGAASTVAFVWDRQDGTSGWDSLNESGADQLGITGSGINTITRTEAYYAYPISETNKGTGTADLRGWKIVIEADCSTTATTCTLGTDWQVTPFTYHVMNTFPGALCGNFGWPQTNAQAQRGLSDWVDGSGAPIAVNSQGWSGWTWAPQAVGSTASYSFLTFEVDQFVHDYTWRFPVTTEALTASFNTQLFFQQGRTAIADQKNRWFNAPSSTPADNLRGFSTPVAAGNEANQPALDAPGFAGQTLYIQRQSNEVGLNLFARVQGSVGSLGATKFQLCFTSSSRANSFGYPGLTTSSGAGPAFQGLAPIQWGSLDNMGKQQRGLVCDLGCYPNRDCSTANLAVGGLSMDDFAVAATNFYATVIAADTSSTGSLYYLDHQIAVAFGHAPNAATTVGLSAVAALLVAAAALL